MNDSGADHHIGLHGSMGDIASPKLKMAVYSLGDLHAAAEVEQRGLGVGDAFTQEAFAVSIMMV